MPRIDAKNSLLRHCGALASWVAALNIASRAGRIKPARDLACGQSRQSELWDNSVIRRTQVLSESRELFNKVDRQAFDALVDDLRMRHRAKRSLMAMLDALPANG